MNDKNIIQLPDGYLNKTPLFQFILLSCLFPLWGCAAALNDILITQFKSVFALSNFASALVQSAFYGGYFLIAIPASLVIKNTSYKVAILIGLTLYILGCTLFFPASHMATYTMFLAAIFAIAIGLSFLETAANTYSSMIGPKAYATLRLNVSQTFYPIGAAAGILLGKYLVFSEGDSLEKQMAGMNAEQIHNFKILMLENTLEPYKYMIMVLVVVMVLFLLTRFPTCKWPQPIIINARRRWIRCAIWRPTPASVAVSWPSSSMWACRSRCGRSPSVWRWSLGISTNATPPTLWSIALPASSSASLSPTF